MFDAVKKFMEASGQTTDHINEDQIDLYSNLINEELAEMNEACMELDGLEHEVLVHRYLYYVEAQPILSDFSYDQLEREARAVLPETSPVHGVGSSLPSSYPESVIKDALSRIS